MNSVAKYDTLLLPELKLKASANSKQAEKRLRYLWSSAHAMLPVNASMAHQLSASMVQLVKQFRIELSDEIRDYLCRQCGGLLVPGLSCTVLVVHQSIDAPLNRKLAIERRKCNKLMLDNGAKCKPERLRNAMRVTCHRCQFPNLQAGASVMLTAKPKQNKKKRSLEPPSDPFNDQEPSAKRSKPTEVPPKPTEPNKPVVKKPEAPSAVASLLGTKPPSPPRKLLDGPKKKKKKKQPNTAATAAKSSLNAFLSSLRPSSDLKR